MPQTGGGFGFWALDSVGPSEDHSSVTFWHFGSANSSLPRYPPLQTKK